MTDEVATDRVTMVWPKELKERVREKVGPRGLTEFTLEAVDLYLKDGASAALAAKELELNEVKNITQLLADRMVMGGTNADRLEALMEVEFPSWIDTSGWPSEFARRVPKDLPELPPDEVRKEAWGGVVVHDFDDLEPMEPGPAGPETAEEMFNRLDKMVDPEPERPEVQTLKPEEAGFKLEPEPEEPWTPKPDGKDDLFARIAAKTGIDPAAIDLKRASDLPSVEPKPQQDLCPTCNEELVMGECWTCG